MLGALVIFLASDVEPVLPDGEAHDLAAGLDEELDKLRHVEVLSGRDEGAGGGRDEVDAGVNEEFDGRLLGHGSDVEAVGFDDAVRDVEAVFADSDGHGSGVLEVEVKEGTKIERRQYIAVDDEQRIIAGYEREGAGGAHGLFLGEAFDLNAEGFALAEVFRDLVTAVVRADVHAGNAGLFELLDESLEERLLADAKHGFRRGGGEGHEPGSVAAGHDDGVDPPVAFASQTVSNQVIEDSEIGDALEIIDERDLPDRTLLHFAEDDVFFAAGRKSDGLRFALGAKSFEQARDGKIEAVTGEDGTAEVAVGEGGEEMALVVDDEGDPLRPMIDASHDLAQGGLFGRANLFDELHHWSRECTSPLGFRRLLAEERDRVC